jgi:hypothetical protein
VTTGSSICRNSNSKNRSKSFICIRNASLNGTTQAQTRNYWERGPEPGIGRERYAARWVGGPACASKAGCGWGLRRP